MNLEITEKSINEAFSNIDKINQSDKKIKNLVDETIELLDQGKIRVAEKKNNKWEVNQWIKKAILLSFKVNEMNAKLSDKFDVKLNRFQVKAGLTRKEWQDKGWIFKEDPLGWFQWYCRFSNGRRIPKIDEIQIKRWKNFTRHVKAIKNNCEEGDMSCRKRQRQAILQWAYNPFI